MAATEEIHGITCSEPWKREEEEVGERDDGEEGRKQGRKGRKGRESSSVAPVYLHTHFPRLLPSRTTVTTSYQRIPALVLAVFGNTKVTVITLRAPLGTRGRDPREQWCLYGSMDLGTARVWGLMRAPVGTD